MIAGLLERIAPHWDPDADGDPDTRSFLERLHTADQIRYETASPRMVRWRGHDLPYWTVTPEFALTHWGVGVDVDSELATPWDFGSITVTVGLGPFMITLARVTPALW